MLNHNCIIPLLNSTYFKHQCIPHRSRSSFQQNLVGICKWVDHLPLYLYRHLSCKGCWQSRLFKNKRFNECQDKILQQCFIYFSEYPTQIGKMTTYSQYFKGLHSFVNNTSSYFFKHQQQQQLPPTWTHWVVADTSLWAIVRNCWDMTISLTLTQYCAILIEPLLWYLWLQW